MTPTTDKPRSETLQTRKQDLVREAIWDAAITLFVAGGFEQTTIDDIARAAGISTRTFFRYFASKSDLMGQGMVRYAALLIDAIHGAPASSSAIEVLRHTVERVATVVAAAPRTREIVQVGSRSAAAREALLSRRAEAEAAVAQAFAVRRGAGAPDEMTPRLLSALTLSILDVTFRMWSDGHAPIQTTVDDVFRTFTALTSHADRPVAAPR